ncbi:MAG: 1-acyl-sn-glycerol-3-phosphate acyltransferase [Christensenellaceae bacterium]|nr:1-acyl-sn-glycerol-3-phosphate acyltransferase [Christensenellaceae bacterium]
MENLKRSVPKKSNLERGRISRFQYAFYSKLFTAFAKIRYGFRIDKSRIKGMKGPFLVLGNHTAWIDFLYFSGCIYPQPLNVVVASNIFYKKFIGGLFKRYGAIPKKQFTADFACIKHIKRFMDNGVSVLLFPEGRITVDGATGYIPPSIGKLVKFLGYPVISGITVGGYATKPKWGRKRPGRITLTMEPVLSAEEIGTMTKEEIFDVISEKFSYDDNRAFAERGRKVYGFRLAEKLEKILYKCPRCGAEFKNVSKGNKLRCEGCGNTVIYRRDGTLEPAGKDDVCFKYISDWYAYERDEVKKETGNEDYTFSENVVLSIACDDTGRFSYAGEGVLTLNPKEIVYKGTENGGKTLKSFGLLNHATVAYKLARNVELAEDEKIYRFEFENGFHTAKFVLAVEELHKKIIKR